MIEHRQIAVFEGRCRRFRNISECLKTHGSFSCVFLPELTKNVTEVTKNVTEVTKNVSKRKT